MNRGGVLLLAVVILLTAFFVRVWRLDEASLWVDEVDAYNWANRSLAGTIDDTLGIGNQVPVYFASIHLLPHDSAFGLRYLPALLGVLAVALLMGVVQRLHGNTDLALWAGALLAVNPYHIQLSRMARPYALLLVLALVVSYVFWRLLKQPRSRWLWIAFVVSSAAAYLTHYFGFMLPVAQFIVFAFVINRKRYVFRRWIVAQGLAGLPVLAWLVILTQTKHVGLGMRWIPDPVVGDLPITFQNLLVGYDGVLRWYMVPGLLAGIVGLALATRYVVRTRQRDLPTLHWFCLAVTPPVLIFGLSRWVPLYVDRYFMEILPGLLVLVLVGLRQVSHVAVSRALQAALVASGAVVSLVMITGGSLEREDWHMATAIVHEQYTAGDALLVQQTGVFKAFEFHFGREALAQLPVYGISDSAVGVYPVTAQDAPVQRMWVVYNARQDGHRLTAMPSPDPYQRTEAPISAWLVDHQDAELARYALRGMTLVLVDMRAD